MTNTNTKTKTMTKTITSWWQWYLSTELFSKYKYTMTKKGQSPIDTTWSLLAGYRSRGYPPFAKNEPKREGKPPPQKIADNEGFLRPKIGFLRKNLRNLELYPPPSHPYFRLFSVFLP